MNSALKVLAKKDIRAYDGHVYYSYTNAYNKIVDVMPGSVFRVFFRSHKGDLGGRKNSVNRHTLTWNIAHYLTTLRIISDYVK